MSSNINRRGFIRTTTLATVGGLAFGQQAFPETRSPQPQKPWRASELDPKWPFDLLATGFTLKPGKTALVIIDMHGLQRNPESELAKKYPKIDKYLHDRLDSTTVPNVQRLIHLFRSRGWKIVYTRNGHLTSTGDEMTRRLRRHLKNTRPIRDNPKRQIDPRLAPRDEDLVVDKLTSGAFTASLLDHALRNMGIECVVIVGIMTDMCVFGTARDAAELGYDSLVCEDACATLTPRAHREALLMHARVFGRVARTQDVIKELTGVEEPGASLHSNSASKKK